MQKSDVFPSFFVWYCAAAVIGISGTASIVVAGSSNSQHENQRRTEELTEKEREMIRVMVNVNPVEFDRDMKSAREASHLFDARVKEFGGINQRAVDAAFKEIRKLPGVVDVGIDSVPDDWFWLRLESNRKHRFDVKIPDGAKYISLKGWSEMDRDMAECQKANRLADELELAYRNSVGGRWNPEGFARLLDRLRLIPGITEVLIGGYGDDYDRVSSCGWSTTVVGSWR